MRFLSLLVCGLLTVLPNCAQDQDLIKLNGAWEFKQGFYEDIQNSASSEWEAVQIPHKFGPHEGWITVRRNLPAAVNKFVAQGLTLALHSGLLGDVSYIYVNGQRIGQLGAHEPYASGMYREYLGQLPFDSLHTERPNVLAISLFSQGDLPIDISGPDILIGPTEKVFKNYYQNEIVLFAFLAIYFVVGGYHLLLTVKRPKDTYNLFFGLFSLGVSCYWFFYTGTRDIFFNDMVELRIKIEYILLFNLGALLILFLSKLVYNQYSGYGIAYAVLNLIFSIITAFSPYPVMRWCLNIWQVITLLLIIPYVIYYITWEVFHKNRDAIYLFMGLILMCVAIMMDIFRSQGWVRTPPLTNYAFLVFVLGMAGLLANRFVRLHNAVEDLNSSLEQKVEDRTSQLRTSLSDVQKLKEQQDADYFLTSLLVTPLNENEAKSSVVHVETCTRQKKKFQFRKHRAELGGDICVARDVQLAGRWYTVFLNGDAMGKSLQGAGGALVLGTVFKAVISAPQLRELTPEHWLQTCYMELQNTFVTFDGYMLVSIVLGMVDEETGLLYYINAEHPYVTLYRDGRASFIENELELRKLGVAETERNFRIKLYQLQPDDVLIIGSDGRDDILLGFDEAGNRIINEDENEFLNRVEEGEGDLDRIEQSILRIGELTDDFTLMRISYREDFPRIIESDTTNFQELFSSGKQALYAQQWDRALAYFEEAHALRNADIQVNRELARLFIYKKSYQQALPYCEAYTRLNPVDTDFLYHTAMVHRKLNDLQTATEYAERCKLREPGFVKNLVLLAELFYLQDHHRKAERFLSQARALEPENSKARQLEQKMKQATSDVA